MDQKQRDKDKEPDPRRNTETYETGGPQQRSGLEQSQPIRRSADPSSNKMHQESPKGDRMDETNVAREPGSETYSRTSQQGSQGGTNWWQQIESGWKQTRDRVREQWDRLTDDDVEEIGGKRDRLEAHIRDRYGVTSDEARRQVDEWGRSLRYS